MRRIKLYLDSSVISHLEAQDTADKMQETLSLWDDIKSSKYEIYLSSVVFEELEDCYEPKRKLLYEYLEQIDFFQLEVNDQVRKIADEIIRLGILKEKHIRDCMHIGCAIISESDYLVSWNFKHLVNIKTVKGVRALTNLFDYKSIDIISPQMLTKKED